MASGLPMSAFDTVVVPDAEGWMEVSFVAPAEQFWMALSAEKLGSTSSTTAYIDDITLRKGWVQDRKCPKPGSIFAKKGKYRYSFNGQERENEINPSVTSAEYWMYDGRLGRRWNTDPRPNVSISPYATFANNPIFFTDFAGDSAIVNNTVEEDPVANAAFKEFISTKQGLKFLSQYAAKGQTLYGYTFKEDGKYHKRGIDLIYKVGTIADASTKGTTEAEEPSESSERARITITLQSNYRGIKSALFVPIPTSDVVMAKTITIFHESFIHADLYAKDYDVDGKFDYSNISEAVKKNLEGKGHFWRNLTEHYQHHQVIIDNRDRPTIHTNLWPMNAFEGLKAVNQRLKVYSSEQELYKMMWRYEGGEK